MCWRLLAPFLACLCVIPAGCGSSGPQGFSGTVSYLGKPIKDGSIQFYSTDGQPAPVAGAMIKDGRYEVPPEHGLMPGTYLVRITAREWDPDPTQGPQHNPFRSRELIPEKYNTASTLKIEVASRSRQTFDFPLN